MFYSPEMVTFPVDDVTPVIDALPTQPFARQFPDALAVGGDAHILKPDGVHPLLSAVAKAFAEHRPLVLSPDAVWLTIARGIAQHVKLHAEELRPLLVGHSGKKRLQVELLGAMPTDAQSWAHIVELFAKQVGDTLFECDFSTSTDVERLAGRVAMLDAYSPYHAYWLVCICGIPSITLTGTVDDWREIRIRVDELSRFGLEHWQRSLVPIADEFVRAAEGKPDTAFWQRIYKPVDAYGFAVCSGWVTRLYPYLKREGTNGVPNEMLDLPIDEPRDQMDADGKYRGPGIRTDSITATLCRAVVNVRDLDDLRAVALDAGLVGVAQDGDGALRPVAGWVLANAPADIEAALDRLIEEHEATPPAAEEWIEGSAETVALYHRIGSASLSGGAVKVRPFADQTAIRIGDNFIRTVLDLADGRHIGEVSDYPFDTTHWVAFREGDDPANVPVLGTSLAHLLDAVMDSGGDIAHLETMKLSQVSVD